MKKSIAVVVAVAAPFGLAAVAAWLIWKWFTGSATMDEKGNYNFTSTATRELRANNPLGLSDSGKDWPGIDYTRSVPNKHTRASKPGVDDQEGDQLLIFQTMQDGVNAAAAELWKSQKYFNQGQETSVHPFTLRYLAEEWGTGWEDVVMDSAGLPEYAHQVAQIMHLPIDTELRFATDGVKFMTALSRIENGTLKVRNFPPEMWQRGVANAITIPEVEA